MKNLIITGPSRAGKTTLAQELSKQLGYNMVSLDDLVDGLSNISDIKEQFDDGFEEITDNLAPFLVRFLKQITLGTTYAHGIRYVVEGSYFNFDALMPEIAKLSDQYEVIGLKYDDLTPESLYNRIRKFDEPEDWTFTKTDDNVREACERFVKLNKRYDNYYKKYNIRAIDTSHGHESAIEKFIQSFKKENNIA